MPRGRPRKHATNGNGAHRSPEEVSDAAIAVLERPQLDVEALKQLQAIVVKGFVEQLKEDRCPIDERGTVARVLAWYATPYEWRQPKTEFEFAEELKVTPMKLRLLRSMFNDGIELALDEIRNAAKMHSKLRFIEAFDGMIDAAKNGNAPAFDRVKSEAWGDEVPGVSVNVGVQVNVEDLRARLMEKLGA